MPDITPNPDPNPNPNPNPNPPITDEKQKEIDRLLTENQNLRKSTKDTEAKVTTLSEQLSALQKQGLKGSEDWKKLAETNEQEATTWKTKFTQVNEAFVGTLVSSKVKEEALKLGLLPEAVNDLDTLAFDEVEAVIDANNKFNVKGAEVAASNLKKLRPHWFKNGAAPNFNHGANGGGAPTQAEGLQSAKEKYETALKNRAKDPDGFAKAHKDYQAAIFEARKTKHQ
jgi:hypothetical protein